MFKTWLGGNRFFKKLLRSLLPRIGSVRVTGKFRVFVDYRDLTGPSYYVMHGGAAAFYHYEEAEKGEIVQGLSAEGVFLDIGANIGLFSFFVARLFPRARVYAFEPHPLLYRCLTQTGEHGIEGGFSGFSATQACVGSENGEIELLLSDRDSGGHTTHANQISSAERVGKLVVPSVSLDSFVASQSLDRIDVIKVDVQGAEWEVLQGAIASLRRFKPKILIELDNEQAVRKFDLAGGVCSQIAEMGYRVRSINSQSPSRIFGDLRVLAQEELAKGVLQTNYIFESKG